MGTSAERATTDWPTTVDEAVYALLSSMPESEKKALEQLPAGELPACRQGLGVWVRNTFGLWRGNGELLASCAAESARREREALMSLPAEELRRLQRRYEQALARMQATAGARSGLDSMRAAWYEQAVGAGPEDLRALLVAGARDEATRGEGVFMRPDAASWVILVLAWERLRGEPDDALWLPWRR